MTNPVHCTITVLIPHGNTIAELEKAVQATGTIFHGCPQCIPVAAEADTAFRDAWQKHRSKFSQYIGFSADVPFADVLQAESGPLSKLRGRFPREHLITFSETPVPADLLPSPAGYTMVMGIQKTPSHVPLEGVSSKGAITCKTFQIATMQLELSETGLLTWQILESCWAPRN